MCIKIYTVISHADCKKMIHTLLHLDIKIYSAYIIILYVVFDIFGEMCFIICILQTLDVFYNLHTSDFRIHWGV